MAKRSRTSHGRRGLRKLRPELIAQAQDQTAATITRIMLTFVGVAVFCLLSLLTPDVALLTGGERLNVPFAGPVSFLGFIIIGPALLIVLRVYLQLYVEHWHRLEPLRRRLPAPSIPTLAPLQNPLLRGFAGFVLYLLLPITMLFFTWKASVLADWGAGLLCLTVAITVGHLSLLVRWPWPARALLAAGGAILAATIVYVEGPLSRPANLFQADLSNQWLPYSHLRNANLEGANLLNANLEGANLQDAHLGAANLLNANRGANLEGTNLEDTNLKGANLGGFNERFNLERFNLESANLEGADLTRANLKGASLKAANLTRANLQGALLLDANLEGANLEDAHLVFANLGGANLEGANLEGANLEDAHLGGANLEGANLEDAHLGGTNLTRADLQGANLTRANLMGCNLMDAKRLTQTQLDQACGDEATRLSGGLSIRPCAQ